MYYIRIALTGIISFFLFTASLSAQVHNPRYNVSIAPNTNGFYEYLPQGYDPAGSQTYPVIIHIHGNGDRGNGSQADLPKLLKVGITAKIDSGYFPNSFTVNGQVHRFIVISPQFVDWPTWQQMESVYNYVVANYKVNTNRVYMTGLSMGGAMTWEFAGSSLANAKKLAAIVPICGASWPEVSRARVIADANLPVWATHNTGDPYVPVSYTNDYVAAINQNPAPNPPAKKTIFNIISHDAWTQTYDPAFKENGLNVYEWMLQFQRGTPSPLPVKLTQYKALKSGAQVIISWTTDSELNNDHFTVERSANGRDFSSIAVIRGANRAQAYTHTDDHPLPTDNFYRLSQTDIDGKVTYFEILKVRMNGSAVAFLVGPNPMREALNIQINAEEKGLITASLFSTTGMLVRQWMLNKTEDGFQQSIQLGDLPAGTYVLRVNGKQLQESQTLIKQ
jgi:dienelactone hydrolase